jgi:hypothetical protein
MEQNLGKEYHEGTQRESFLKDNCDRAEKKGYMKPFTPEQLQGYKESLAELSIQIEQTEDEKKEAARCYKKMLDPLTERRTEMIRNIRQKAEYVNEVCYKFVDRDERQTGYYNADGDLIELRPATADELQGNLFSMKTGTNN